MKVFLSWSGEVSHKVALVLREWLPLVIQSIQTYVSSEDIDKGARWSSDIAKELEDSSFGILCITKDNINEPWLNFEAGALSKTIDKSYVSPFLFDIRRAEVKGPILQFQSTILDKEDIKKLIVTINKACDTTALDDSKLDNTFEVWYPQLVEKLGEIDTTKSIEEETNNPASTSSILEEVLEVTRNNQKILRNTENDNSDNLKEISSKIEKLNKNYNNLEWDMIRRKDNTVMFLDDIRHFITDKPKSEILLSLQIYISYLKYDLPILYDISMDFISSIDKREFKEAGKQLTKLKKIRNSGLMRKSLHMFGERHHYMYEETIHLLYKTFDEIRHRFSME